MNRLLRGTELVGLPVVTCAGEDVAEIRDVVYEPDRGGIVGFTLNKRGFFSGRLKQVLPIDMIVGIGKDAVVLADTDALTERAEAPAPVAEASSKRNVIGNAVITDAGQQLGEISDVVLSVGRHTEVVGYELGGDVVTNSRGGRHVFIPMPEQIAISGEALIVPADLDRFVRHDLSGFGTAVDEYRTEHHNGTSGS